MVGSNFKGMGATGVVAFAAMVAMGAPVPAQESVIFSLTSSGTAPFGTLADTEMALFDPQFGACRPWCSIASAAFFAGDLDGDGVTDEWKDVDAIHVEQVGGRVTELYVSFNSTTGPWLDGDIVRVLPNGSLALAWSEARLIADFGLTDGQMDVDGMHLGSDGRLFVSFSDDEASSILSTDVAGVITDGSIVSWDGSKPLAAVEVTEAGIDGFVSHALGKNVKTGDTLSVAMDVNGVLAFTVQSPSSDDATVFRVSNGGEIVVSETQLGLTGAPEIDALELVDAPVPFLATRVSPRSVPANVSAQISLDGAANHAFVVTLALARGDAANLPADGFVGLFLDPIDPLFSASLADFTFTYGVTDGAGQGTLQFDPAPPGITLTLYAQAYDFDGHTFGMPLALELEG